MGQSADAVARKRQPAHQGAVPRLMPGFERKLLPGAAANRLVVARRLVRDRQFRERTESKLVQIGAGQEHPFFECGSVGQRKADEKVAAVQAHGVVELLNTSRACLAPFMVMKFARVQQPLECGHIQPAIFAGPQPHGLPVDDKRASSGTERTAQVGEHDAQTVSRIIRRCIGPQERKERLALVGAGVLDCEVGEQRQFLARAESHRCSIRARYVRRAKQCKPQRGHKLLHCNRAGEGSLSTTFGNTAAS